MDWPTIANYPRKNRKELEGLSLRQEVLRIQTRLARDLQRL
jgi:hypothetical protein